MNKLLTAVLALACLIAPARSVYAQDNNTEFGIADDLTVLGTGGTTTSDPDVEIKGFTVFGSTEADHDLGIPKAPGNIYANGYVQVSSGLYVAGSSTFTARVKLPNATSIFINDGAAGQVMRKQADGSLTWSDSGSAGLTGTPLRLLMIDSDGAGAAPSLFLQNADDGVNATNITMVAGSSMTILGISGGDGLGVTGAVKIDGALSVLNGGLTSLSGALTVTGASTLTGALNVDNAAYFGAAATKSTFTATGDLQMYGGADISLSGDGKITLIAAPNLGTDAANKDYVDSKVGSAVTDGPWTKVMPNTVKLSTITDNVGIGIAAPVAKLHVSSASALPGDLLLVVSSGTAASERLLVIKGNGDTGLKGNLAIGSTYSGGAAPADGLAVEGAVAIGTTAPDANTRMQVTGADAQGAYISKFYSGVKLAAWVKQK